MEAITSLNTKISVTDKELFVKTTEALGVSGFLCLGRLFQGQPNEAALCI